MTKRAIWDWDADIRADVEKAERTLLGEVAGFSRTYEDDRTVRLAVRDAIELMHIDAAERQERRNRAQPTGGSVVFGPSYPLDGHHGRGGERTMTNATTTRAARIEALKTWLLGMAEADGVALTDEDETIVDALADAAFGHGGKNRNWPTVTRVRAAMDQEARTREQQRQHAQQERDRALQREWDDAVARAKGALRAQRVQDALMSTRNGREAARFNEEQAAAKRAQFTGPGPNAPVDLYKPSVRRSLAASALGRQILREHGIDPDTAA